MEGEEGDLEADQEAALEEEEEGGSLINYY